MVKPDRQPAAISRDVFGQGDEILEALVHLGGILDTCGLGRFFLANSDEAEAEMDQGLQDLIALAEHVATDGGGLSIRSGQAGNGAGKAAKDWLSTFLATQVLRDQLIAGNDKSKTTLIGKFLAARLTARSRSRRPEVPATRPCVSRDPIAAEGLLLRDRRGLR